MAQTEQPAAGEQRGAAAVSREYFEAIGRHDLDTAANLWKPGGIDKLVGLAELRAPEGFREWFGGLLAAFPDFTLTIQTIVAEGEQAAVRWSATGTFNGTGSFEGLEPNGASMAIEGCDVVTVADGLIVSNFAYLNGADMVRQLGGMPPSGSVAERGLLGALNAKTAATEAVKNLRGS